MCASRQTNLGEDQLLFRHVNVRTKTEIERTQSVLGSTPLSVDAIDEELEDRPVFRSDCVGHDRPCPYIGCRHHFASDETVTGHPRLAIGFLMTQRNCVLDFADQNPDGAPLADIGAALLLTRERVRQIEVEALQKMKRSADDLRIDIDFLLLSSGSLGARETRDQPADMEDVMAEPTAAPKGRGRLKSLAQAAKRRKAKANGETEAKEAKTNGAVKAKPTRVRKTVAKTKTAAKTKPKVAAKTAAKPKTSRKTKAGSLPTKVRRTKAAAKGAAAKKSVKAAVKKTTKKKAKAAPKAAQPRTRKDPEAYVWIAPPVVKRGHPKGKTVECGKGVFMNAWELKILSMIESLSSKGKIEAKQIVADMVEYVKAEGGPKDVSSVVRNSIRKLIAYKLAKRAGRGLLARGEWLDALKTRKRAFGKAVTAARGEEYVQLGVAKAMGFKGSTRLKGIESGESVAKGHEAYTLSRILGIDLDEVLG